MEKNISKAGFVAPPTGPFPIPQCRCGFDVKSLKDFLRMGSMASDRESSVCSLPWGIQHLIRPIRFKKVKSQGKRECIVNAVDLYKYELVASDSSAES